MQIIGITCSTAAALFWAVAIILFKKSGDHFSPMALNLFKCTVTLILLIPTLLLGGIDLFPEKPAYDWIMFCVSGLLGIALADTIFFIALSRLGAGMIAIVDCLYLPIVIFISFVFLDEILGIKGLFGATLVFIAIFVGSASKKGISVTGIDFFIGIILGIFAIILIAGSIVMLKRLLEDTNVLWASFARVLAGTIGLYLVVLLSPGHDRTLSRSPVKPRQKKTAGRALSVKNMVFRSACISCRQLYCNDCMAGRHEIYDGVCSCSLKPAFHCFHIHSRCHIPERTCDASQSICNNSGSIRGHTYDHVFAMTRIFLYF